MCEHEGGLAMEPDHGCAGGWDGMDGMVCRGRAEILKVAREGERGKG